MGRGGVNDILHSKYSSCANCENNNFHFTQNNSDPQIIFTDLQYDFRGVEIVLGQPSLKKMDFQLYWSNSNEFKESDSYRGKIQAGEKSVKVPVEKGSWDKLRFDMDGTFTLASFSTIENSYPTYRISASDIRSILRQEAIFLMIYITAIAIHIHKGKRKKNYIGSLLGNSDKPRNYAYDYLRVLAVIMVICTHAIQSDMGFVDEKSPKFFIMTLVYTLCLSCNLIYVMISGALLLPYKDEPLGSFYLHRVTRVALPMIVYFVIYLWNWEGFSFSAVLDRIVTGNTPEAPHYWLLYVLLSLYIVFPFFRYLFKNIEYKVLTKFVMVILIFMALSVYVPIVYKPIAVNTFISSWIGVAIIGYWLSREETRKYDTVLIWLGILSAFITAVIITRRENFLDLTTNTVPTMVLFSCFVFSVVFKCKSIFQKKNMLVCFFSKYSYSIILIHWWVLYFVTRQRFNVHAYQLGFIGGLGISLAVTLLTSAAIALLIDNFIIVSMETIFLSIVCNIKKIFLSLKSAVASKGKC